MNAAVLPKPAPRLASGRAGAVPGEGPAAEPVLVLNCGSSSIKFALFDASVTPLPRQPLWAGQVEGIGGKGPKLVQAGSPPTALVLDADKPYDAALRHVRATVVAQTGGRPPAAVVHRVVHGGTKYAAPVPSTTACSPT
jgi:acetate kinase